MQWPCCVQRSALFPILQFLSSFWPSFRSTSEPWYGCVLNYGNCYPQQKETSPTKGESSPNLRVKQMFRRQFNISMQHNKMVVDSLQGLCSSKLWAFDQVCSTRLVSFPVYYASVQKTAVLITVRQLSNQRNNLVQQVGNVVCLVCFWVNLWWFSLPVFWIAPSIQWKPERELLALFQHGLVVSCSQDASIESF